MLVLQVGHPVRDLRKDATGYITALEDGVTVVTWDDGRVQRYGAAATGVLFAVTSYTVDPAAAARAAEAAGTPVLKAKAKAEPKAKAKKAAKKAKRKRKTKG